MRSRRGIIVLSAMLLIALVMTTSPGSGHGATAYEMEGGGNLTLTSGPGLGFTGAPTTSTYTFATLPILGHGVLEGHTVTALYNCPSSVKITGVGLNFTISWTFTCNRTTGSGPNQIKGNFAGKFPVFKGKFIPYINGVPHSSAPSTCSGMAVPTQVQNNRVKKMTFVGECTAVSG